MNLTFLLLLFLVSGIGLTALTVFLVAMWRWMRAHEKVAHTLAELVRVLDEKS